jgi:hypothetical protein
MAWIIFLLIAFLTAAFAVPFKHWKILWPAGIIGMLVLYCIDRTLIGLGAYSFTGGSPFLSGVPTFYWISGFCGGILIVYFYPVQKRRRIPYLLLGAFLFLMTEFIMNRLGFFHYLKWDMIHSYLLNLIGLGITLWLSECLGAVGKKGPDQYSEFL